jgi:hypothetical protein
LSRLSRLSGWSGWFACVRGSMFFRVG